MNVIYVTTDFQSGMSGARMMIDVFERQSGDADLMEPAVMETAKKLC